MDTKKLRLEIIRDIDTLAALAPQWDALSDTLPLQIPFTSASWNLFWWHHLRAARLLIHDYLHVFVLRDQHEQLIAVAPMMISVRPSLGAYGVKILQFFGADPNITEIRGIICHPNHACAAIAVLQDYLQKHCGQWDWIEWHSLSPEQTAQLPTPELSRSKASVMYYVPLPATWDELKQGLSRNMKEAIRKGCNSLKRNQHSHAFNVIEKENDLAPAMATFFRLHQLRATSLQGVPHSNVFRDRKGRNFLSAYAAVAAAQNKFRLFQLSVDGEVVASRIGFVSRRQLYLYYSGYDTTWGKYSVMTTLMIHIMQWAIKHGYDCVNLSTGCDHSKLRWRPQVVRQHNVIQISPYPRASFLFKTYMHLKRYSMLQCFSRVQ